MTDFPADKGLEGGACNRSACLRRPAVWYNHGSYAWYCADCRKLIEFDAFNRRDWDLYWFERKGHPQFETREMMDKRKAA